MPVTSQGDDHIQPFLDHFAIHAGDLEQHEAENRAHDQLPHALDPQMHHPPPEIFILDQVGRVVESEQEEHRQTDQTDQQDRADRGLAAFEDGHADVVQKGQRHHDNAQLGG
jgi:hypothetical protein